MRAVPGATFQFVWNPLGDRFTQPRCPVQTLIQNGEDRSGVTALYQARPLPLVL
jgi:hypothetical protein